MSDVARNSPRWPIRIRKGLDLPIPGVPVQTIEGATPPRSVGLLGGDFLKAPLVTRVSVGDRVRIGHPLFADRRNPNVHLPSPASGVVAGIHRGDAGHLGAIEIEVRGNDSIEFSAVDFDRLGSWSREATIDRLLASGDWIALRARPFGTIATPGATPAAIFIRAMDSNPLAAAAEVVLATRHDDLSLGLRALSRLTDGPLYFCSRPGLLDRPPDIERLQIVEVTGPHPAGLVGTHIHHLMPVSEKRHVWYVGYQDVLSIGHLFRTGRPDVSRVISLAGPSVRRPRLLRTTLGASTEDLVRGELSDEQCRIVSGSLLSGRTAARPGAFLGRYHEQLCAIPERVPKQKKGFGTSSWKAVRHVLGPRAGRMWSNELLGEPNGFFPIGRFDRAFPLRLPLSPLLRALAAGDLRASLALGALEVEEEDLALSSFLCPAKLEYGALLREALDEIAMQLP